MGIGISGIVIGVVGIPAAFTFGAVDKALFMIAISLVNIVLGALTVREARS